MVFEAAVRGSSPYHFDRVNGTAFFLLRKADQFRVIRSILVLFIGDLKPKAERRPPNLGVLCLSTMLRRARLICFSPTLASHDGDSLSRLEVKIGDVNAAECTKNPLRVAESSRRFCSHGCHCRVCASFSRE